MNSRQDSRENASAKPERRLSRPKRWLLFGGGALCLVAWIVLAIGIYIDVERNTFIVLVTFAAIATEGLFWLAAAVLGVTVFQARRRIWSWLSLRPDKRL